jgi:FkbM family methyltransferase
VNYIFKTLFDSLEELVIKNEKQNEKSLLKISQSIDAICCINNPSFKKNKNLLGLIAGLFNYEVYKPRSVFSTWHNNRENIEKARHFLADKASVDVFDSIIRYRLIDNLFGEEVSSQFCPVNDQEWEAAKKRAEELFDSRKITGLSQEDVDFSCTCTFGFGQYSYGDIVELKKGDVFIDGGACLGETSLWAAQKVGEGGKVYAFEPNPQIYGSLQLNISKYKNMKDIILPLNFALGANSGFMNFKDKGVGSSLHQKGKIKVAVTALDHYLMRNPTNKLDFIKLDVEGAEQAALLGAAETIKRFMPKLAICVYHRPADIYEIPILLKNICSSYKFFLRHCSNTPYETVLYGIVE